MRTHNTHQYLLRRRKKKSTALTWSPPNGSFLPAAETDFAEDPQEMPLAERAGVLAGAGATFRSRDPVAVRLPRLAFLPDKGAGDRGHLPETSLKNRESSSAEVGSWCGFLAQKNKQTPITVNVCFGSTSVSTKCHPGQIILRVPGIIALEAASF